MKKRLLVVHTHYLQKGGEDQAFTNTVAVLRALGHEVETMVFHNRELDSLSGLKKFTTTLWNAKAAKTIGRLCRIGNIAGVHFHNTFPLASPAVYGAAKQAGAKVFQWIHNYRLVCPGSSFFRKGQVCESCLGKAVAWPSLIDGCYRESRAATAAVVAMQAMHRARGTWARDIDRFLVYTDFVGRKLAEGGIPSDRIRVIPNLADPDPGEGPGGGGYGLFVGRLTFEKGAKLLLEALEIAPKRSFKIVGGGPMSDEIRAFAETRPHIEFIVNASNQQVRLLMSRAEYLVLPSLWYEGGGPLTAVESLAHGTPLIAADLGNLPHYTSHRRTGLLFRPGNAQDMAAAMHSMMLDDEPRAQMRRNARADYVQRFSFEAQKKALESIMQEVL